MKGREKSQKAEPCTNFTFMSDRSYIASISVVNARTIDFLTHVNIIPQWTYLPLGYALLQH